MTAFIALLRAVNVGGTGPLPMTVLKATCEDAGFARVQTYIASGNVVFTADVDAERVKADLESRLAAHAGRPIGVLVRTAAEMAAVLAAHPFPDAPGNRVVAIFLDAAPPADAIATARGRADEEIVLGRREIYVRYGAGMADSKLKLAPAGQGTARNMNTVAKLAAMAGALQVERGAAPERPAGNATG